MDDSFAVPVTFRVLGPHERGRFAPDAWGHLLRLSGSGLVDPVELEHIIERALITIDGRIGLNDLRVLLGESWPAGLDASDDHLTIH